MASESLPSDCASVVHPVSDPHSSQQEQKQPGNTSHVDVSGQSIHHGQRRPGATPLHQGAPVDLTSDTPILLLRQYPPQAYPLQPLERGTLHAMTQGPRQGPPPDHRRTRQSQLSVPGCSSVSSQPAHHSYVPQDHFQPVHPADQGKARHFVRISKSHFNVQENCIKTVECIPE